MNANVLMRPRLALMRRVLLIERIVVLIGAHISK